jgi:hypothetical protein
MAERMNTAELHELIVETKRKLREAQETLSQATSELRQRLEDDDDRKRA